MIGEFRNRVTIRSWGSSKDDAGGNTAVNIGTWSLWAKVEDRSGSIINGHDQEQWQYDYKITLRYEALRPMVSSNTIDHGGNRLKINSLQLKSEGKNKFWVCRCSTVESLTIDTSFLDNNDMTYEYFGTGNESTFTATSVINKRIIVAFKDGVEFQVVITGIPTGKQVKYTASTGVFDWSIPFTAGEYSKIVYANV